ncbi:hypothetical protein TNCV_2111481 [Trichonephila clavipes]|nr:hypothetical protein TNCV_2111481 [Trichonephila clavipes]
MSTPAVTGFPRLLNLTYLELELLVMNLLESQKLGQLHSCFLPQFLVDSMPTINLKTCDHFSPFLVLGYFTLNNQRLTINLTYPTQRSTIGRIDPTGEVLTIANGAPDLQRGLNLLSNTWGAALKILLALVKIKWKINSTGLLK